MVGGSESHHWSNYSKARNLRQLLIGPFQIPPTSISSCLWQRLARLRQPYRPTNLLRWLLGKYDSRCDVDAHPATEDFGAC